MEDMYVGNVDGPKGTDVYSTFVFRFTVYILFKKEFITQLLQLTFPVVYHILIESRNVPLSTYERAIERYSKVLALQSTYI